MSHSESVVVGSPSVREEMSANGSVGAAILSAGIGCFVLAVLAVLADASKAIAGWLTFYLPTGPLSGVSSTAIIAWLVAWWVLARLWRNRIVAIGKVNAWAFFLLILSLLLTFPPFEHILLGK